MRAALAAGTFLARVKKYVLRDICQALILVLNLTMVALVMWPASKRSHPKGAVAFPSPGARLLLPSAIICAKTGGKGRSRGP
jgi:hypothetical protein